MVKKPPPPSRADARDTSPPLRGVEDRPSASLAPILSPHEVGERWLGEAETERGNPVKPTRSRRKSGTTERARALRWVANSAEGQLWQELKSRQLGGYHFTRQHPIGRYFADFCCRKKKLVVEIDGSQHADSVYDCRRDAFMRAQGYSILRFWSHDVLKHRTSVCETILAVLDGQLSESAVASDLRFVPASRTNSNTPSELKRITP